MGDEISFKIILLGDFGVGKSSIIQRYVEAKFTDENPVTLGTEFKTKIVETSSKKRVKLIIWDSAGQERFRTITSSFYRGASGIILAFDITDAKTFSNAQTNWLNDINTNKAIKSNIYLVGTKLDLESKRVVQKSEAEAFASSNSINYFEVSSKTGVGIEELFSHIVTDLFSAHVSLAKSGNQSNAKKD